MTKVCAHGSILRRALVAGGVAAGIAAGGVAVAKQQGGEPKK